MVEADPWEIRIPKAGNVASEEVNGDGLHSEIEITIQPRPLDT